MEKSNIGSSFDEFLQEESLLEEVTDTAIERVVNWLLPEASEQPKDLGLAKSCPFLGRSGRRRTQGQKAAIGHKQSLLVFTVQVVFGHLTA